MQTLIYLIGFALICLASHRIGLLFSWLRLPYITGYLFTGVLVGSFGLDFIPTSASESLRFIDQIALAVIAFVAGSELFYKDLISRLRSILWTFGLIIVAAFIALGTTIYLLVDVIPFTQGLPPTEKVVVAFLGATTLLALSPPSTIAVIKEVRACGPATRLILGVTIGMDVAIIMFAINSSLAQALVNSTGVSLTFLGVLLLDLALAVGLGTVIWRLLVVLLDQRLPRLAKIAGVVLIGYSVYLLSGLLRTYDMTSVALR